MNATRATMMNVCRSLVDFKDKFGRRYRRSDTNHSWVGHDNCMECKYPMFEIFYHGGPWFGWWQQGYGNLLPNAVDARLRGW